MKERITSATCRSCGACCVSHEDQETYCDVTAADEKRLGKRFVRLHVLRSGPFDMLAAAVDGAEIPPGAIATEWRRQKAGPHAGYEMNACVALRGSVGSRVSCSVYANRPRACRVAVKPGDRVCREIRAAFAREVAP